MHILDMKERIGAFSYDSRHMSSLLGDHPYQSAQAAPACGVATRRSHLLLPQRRLYACGVARRRSAPDERAANAREVFRA